MRHHLLVGLTVMASTALSSPAIGRADTSGAAQLRVDQAGYGPRETKQAVLMTSTSAAGVTWSLQRHGRTVGTGTVAAATDRGAWNSAYRHTYPLTFRASRAGTYQLVVHSHPQAKARVVVRSVSSLYRTVLDDGVAFDQVQRDGADVVPGALHREPSHLHDARATVYATPTFNDDDAITSALKPIGGPVDVAGGWFDAGDFLKFTHTAAYADIVLEAAQRDLGPRAPRTVAAEARFGLDWLSKMWNPATKTLYLQVGTGNGTADGNLLGDHDLWRLPQADDRDADPADRIAASYRPVFEAAAPGQPISPNLAGRVAAAFAMAAQNDARANSRRALAEYHTAAQIIALAATAAPPSPLTTSAPNDFYPEATWRDDMELGTAELARAAQRLHLDATGWLVRSAHWARQYITHETGDTFNLYDTSALAHTDLIRALDAQGHCRRPAALAVTRADLVADLGRQLRGAAAHAAHDPFRAAGNVDDFDVDSHTFGVIATAGWYHQVTGSTAFDRLALEQRNWLFGTNAWGASFMVGIGASYPHCMQHQVANLSGSTDGRPPVALGAVVNGPNSAALFDGGLGGFQDGMRHCAVTSYAPFDGHGARFVDDVRTWQTDEPALDMTGSAIAAATAQLGRG